ncbi:hypothetical protein G2W53_035230 [Senna tora]|uniref:Uncharacterized protein n=1 Tax=Senna tora TaxID=362788 RepID=A0A834SVF5_9FABA|nr:hypothetical protein G2W53_035230 [Senna tora]
MPFRQTCSNTEARWSLSKQDQPHCQSPRFHSICEPTPLATLPAPSPPSDSTVASHTELPATLLRKSRHQIYVSTLDSYLEPSLPRKRLVIGVVEVVAERPAGHEFVHEDHLLSVVAVTNERDQVRMAEFRQHVDLRLELEVVEVVGGGSDLSYGKVTAQIRRFTGHAIGSITSGLPSKDKKAQDRENNGSYSSTYNSDYNRSFPAFLRVLPFRKNLTPSHVDPADRLESGLVVDPNRVLSEHGNSGVVVVIGGEGSVEVLEEGVVACLHGEEGIETVKGGGIGGSWVEEKANELLARGDVKGIGEFGTREASCGVRGFFQRRRDLDFSGSYRFLAVLEKKNWVV